MHFTGSPFRLELRGICSTTAMIKESYQKALGR
jgi:hypothetical protein